LTLKSSILQTEVIPLVAINITIKCYIYTNKQDFFVSHNQKLSITAIEMNVWDVIWTLFISNSKDAASGEIHTREDFLHHREAHWLEGVVPAFRRLEISSFFGFFL
jgi:hypothetical protein